MLGVCMLFRSRDFKEYGNLYMSEEGKGDRRTP